MEPCQKPAVERPEHQNDEAASQVHLEDEWLLPSEIENDLEFELDAKYARN